MQVTAFPFLTINYLMCNADDTNVDLLLFVLVREL